MEAREADGGSLLVQTLGAGDALGWSWLFPPFVWHFQATAAEPARAIALSDALHCQRNIAREIVESDADSGLALKGNQGTASAEVKASLDHAIARKETHLATLETLGKEHGRIEERGHRGVENGLHWVLDVVFGEDQR